VRIRLLLLMMMMTTTTTMVWFRAQGSRFRVLVQGSGFGWLPPRHAPGADSDVRFRAAANLDVNPEP